MTSSTDTVTGPPIFRESRESWITEPLPKNYGLPQPERCIAVRCAQPNYTRGLCRAHYSRWWRREASGVEGGDVSRRVRGAFEDRLRCHLCERPLMDHKLTETCLPGPMAGIV